MLSWWENHTKEEIPPEHIWEDNEALKEWWDRIREKRGLPAGDEESEEMVENELAREFRRT